MELFKSKASSDWFIPHDVSGSGRCLFKSVSNQLYENTDRQVEIRMAGTSHLHNHPELYIESISEYITWAISGIHFLKICLKPIC